MGEIKFVYDVIICYNRCIAISTLDCCGLCSRWHPLWGVKWDNRCVWGATYDSPQLFSRTLSQVTPSSYCLRWLPTVVTARFDFGPGSTWFWTRVHLILDPGPFDYDYDYDYAFPSAIGQGWPSLSCKFSMQIRPVPFICEDSQVAPHSVSGDSPQRVAVFYTVYRVECYVLSNLIWKFS